MGIYLVVILVVWGLAEARLLLKYEEWRSRRRLESHDSYLGVLVGWSNCEESFSITLANVSVARARASGVRSTGMALEEHTVLSVEIPRVADIESFCRGWVIRGVVVRVELVQRDKQILFFSILDETGVGISRLRPEFLSWGNET